MKKKIICLLIPSLQVGGMERVMSEIARQWSKKKEVNLHLVLYGKNPGIFYSLPQSITIHRPSFVFKDKQRFWFTIKTLYFLRKKIKALKPHSILSFGEYWNSFTLLALLGMKYPVYISDRCQPDKNFGRLHTFLRKWLYPKAYGIIAQTNIAKEIFQKQKLNNNIRVIGNPIRKIEVDKVSIKKENIILTVGRLIKTKHHDELIKIFDRVNNPDWKLVIVGDDAIKQKNRILLQKLVEELKLEDRVVLAGTCNNVDIFYQKSKIFAFTSSSEGFPNVIGEAQSVGLPVIAFDCVAGPADLIRDGENGFLAPVFDFETFGHRLHQLIKDENLRKKLGLRAKETVKKFSANCIAEDFYKMITGS